MNTNKLIEKLEELTALMNSNEAKLKEVMAELAEANAESREIPDSWDEIIQSTTDGSYKAKYKVGDYKPLDLGDEGILHMVIVAIDTDTLKDGGKAPVTWVSKELLKTSHRMNPFLRKDLNNEDLYEMYTGSVGGWQVSEMRMWLEDYVSYLIPENVRRAIQRVLKKQSSYDVYGDECEQVSVDKLWIPSIEEITQIYKEAFPDESSRKKYLVGDDRPSPWWLRSASSAYRFIRVYTDGSFSYYYYALNSYGVALGFCI